MSNEIEVKSNSPVLQPTPGHPDYSSALEETLRTLGFDVAELKKLVVPVRPETLTEAQRENLVKTIKTSVDPEYELKSFVHTTAQNFSFQTERQAESLVVQVIETSADYGTDLERFRSQLLVRVETLLSSLHAAVVKFKSDPHTAQFQKKKKLRKECEDLLQLETQIETARARLDTLEARLVVLEGAGTAATDPEVLESVKLNTEDVNRQVLEVRTRLTGLEARALVQKKKVDALRQLDN